MITEQQAKTLFANANPILNTDPIYVDAANYLATLEQRSSEMTQLDTKPVEEEKPKRRRLVLVLSTAAAAILIGAVLLLTQSEETPPAIQPTPTTVAVVEIPSTVAAVEEPTIVEEVVDQVPEGVGAALEGQRVDAIL